METTTKVGENYEGGKLIMSTKKQPESEDCNLLPGEIRNALAEIADNYDHINKNAQTAPEDSKLSD